VFEGDLDTSKIKTISPLEIVSNNIPYIEKSQTGFLYEIWERAYNFTLLESYKNDTIKELADLEFDNIKESIKEDDDLLGILFNNVKNEIDLRTLLQSLSPFERYTYYKDQLSTTQYISDVLNESFKIEQYTSISDIKVDNGVYPKLNDELLNYTPESYRKDIYPFNSSTYLSYLNKDKFTDDNGSIFLISKIMPDYYIFDKKYVLSSNYPFYYFGCTLKKDGTPKKRGNIFTRNLENHPELKDKIIKEDASKNLQITKEEIINEVLELSKRIKQLDLKKDRVIIKYCISSNF
jgi:hypothetical protein